MIYHLSHNGLSVLHTRLTPELVGSQPILRQIFAEVLADGQLRYSLPASLMMGLIGLVLLLWLKSLPYDRSAEERLQEALDHQLDEQQASLPGPAVSLPAKSPA